MGIRVLIIKKSTMSKTSVGENKEMKKRKIYCAKISDKIDRIEYKKKLKKNNNYSVCEKCSCS